MIKAQKLVRKYGDFTAVDELSFSIEKGEIVGLLGHNGAGKTTVMKMLTGYLEPTAGEISVDGLDILSDRLEIQKKIGYLPENCPLYTEMTVVDYLEYVAGLRGIDESNQIEVVRRAIDRTELREKATSRINTLSRGYRQRVGVAQAIIHDPDILVLDEPTNGLDPSQIEGMRNLITDLSNNATVIISTHILQEVQAVCDRVIIIRQGCLALDSRLEELRRTDRLLLTTDRGAKDVNSKIGTLSGVRSVELLRESGKEHHYMLEVEQNGRSITPSIAKTVVESGFELYALHPERRDLETVFREINSGGKA